MISSKGKHNFWSHLLLSMIAIFALPATQGTEHQHNTGGEGYQSQQIQRQSLTAVSLKRQIQIKPYLLRKSAVNFSKLFKIEPHFADSFFAFHAPIRGSPANFPLIN